MLANDASQPAQQRDFEPARSLSWTHPRRNRAGAVIRVSYDSLASLYPSSLCLPFTLSSFPLFAPLRTYAHLCIRNAVHLAFRSQPSRSQVDIGRAEGRMRDRADAASTCFTVGTQLPTENWPPPYLRWRIYYRVATTGRHKRRLISINDSPISSVIANSTTTAATRARARECLDD